MLSFFASTPSLLVGSSPKVSMRTSALQMATIAEYEATYGPLTKAICAYHVIKGEVSTDGLASAPLETTEGSTITYRRMFRKDFVDNAFADVKCDNGVYHGINEVIYPGWSESAGG